MQWFKTIGTTTSASRDLRIMNGTFDDFLRTLLVQESTIDPARFDWYVQAFDSPGLSYPAVSAPGRALRDHRTGRLIFADMTVAQYFQALGIDDLFDAANPACIEPMQYAATNALGFIGFQFGEAALIDAGYYRPLVVRCVNRRGLGEDCESYYVGSLPPSTWKLGRTELLHRMPGTRRVVLATDVNRWLGRFTDKNGVGSVADLRNPEKQRVVMRDFLDANYRRLNAIFREHRYDPSTSSFSWSALLAAAHLCGCEATANFILARKNAKDEFGTSIRMYLETFKDFQTPYDVAPR